MMYEWWRGHVICSHGHVMLKSRICSCNWGVRVPLATCSLGFDEKPDYEHLYAILLQCSETETETNQPRKVPPSTPPTLRTKSKPRWARPSVISNYV